MKTMTLEQEMSTYKANLNEWKEHAGEFVLIQGDEVCGFFTSYVDALQRGYEKFGLTPFLVKQVNILEKIHLVTRLFSPCPTSPGR